MKLDHFVVHIDNDEKILSNLKSIIEPMGFPFELNRGKGTQGFKVANIWIGRQYFEIVRLLHSDGGGWVHKWVKHYNNRIRGLYCIFLATNDIDNIVCDLKDRGVEVEGPERVSFKGFFGLIQKMMPWRHIYLPPIPGTHLEIGFIEYDPDPQDRFKTYFTPNSDKYGIKGIHSAIIQLPMTNDSRVFLQKIFPKSSANENQLNIPLSEGNLLFQHHPEQVDITLLTETSDQNRKGQTFRILDVTVKT